MVNYIRYMSDVSTMNNESDVDKCFLVVVIIYFHAFVVCNNVAVIGYNCHYRIKSRHRHVSHNFKPKISSVSLSLSTPVFVFQISHRSNISHIFQICYICDIWHLPDLASIISVTSISILPVCSSSQRTVLVSLNTKWNVLALFSSCRMKPWVIIRLIVLISLTIFQIWLFRHDSNNVI